MTVGRPAGVDYRGRPRAAGHTRFCVTPVALRPPCARLYALTPYDVPLLPTYEWYSMLHQHFINRIKI